MHEYRKIAVDGVIFENQQHECSKCKKFVRTAVLSIASRKNGISHTLQKAYCIDCAVADGALNQYYAKVNRRVINEALMMYRSLRLKYMEKGNFNINDANSHLQGIYSVDLSNVGLTENANFNRDTDVVMFNNKRERLFHREYTLLEMNVIHGVIETMLRAEKVYLATGDLLEVGCPNCLQPMRERKMSEKFDKKRRVFCCMNSKCQDNLKNKIAYEVTSDGIKRKELGKPAQDK